MEIYISTLLGLKKVIAPKLHDYGFKYVGKKTSDVWVFSREYEGIIQFIEFQKVYANPDCLRFNLCTSVSKEVLRPDDIDHNISLSSLVYENEESFIRVLNGLLELIIESGIRWLNKMSKPDIIVTGEHFNALALIVKNSNFTVVRSIPLDEGSSLVQNIETKIKKQSNNGTELPDWDFIINTAFELGEVIRLSLYGEWSLEGVPPRPRVIRIGGGESKRRYSPLMLVANYWGKPDYLPYSLVDSYKTLEKFKTIG